MQRWSRLIPVLAILAAAMGCESGRHSSAGFRLPPDGSIERGKAAFVSLGCNSCHEVYGVGLPKPTIQPPVPVILGGEVNKEVSDGYLTASIIHPSYRLASYPKNQIAVGNESRMPHFTGDMTVQQLVDIVEFLQSTYKIREVPLSQGYR